MQKSKHFQKNRDSGIAISQISRPLPGNLAIPESLDLGGLGRWGLGYVKAVPIFCFGGARVARVRAGVIFRLAFSGYCPGVEGRRPLIWSLQLGYR